MYKSCMHLQDAPIGKAAYCSFCVCFKGQEDDSLSIWACEIKSVPLSAGHKRGMDTFLFPFVQQLSSHPMWFSALQLEQTAA